MCVVVLLYCLCVVVLLCAMFEGFKGDVCCVVVQCVIIARLLGVVVLLLCWLVGLLWIVW